MEGILSWVIFGLVAGAVAKWLMPGNDPKGCLVTIAIGIVGAVVGGYIGTHLGWGDIRGFDLRSFALAIGGALLVLYVHRALSSRKF